MCGRRNLRNFSNRRESAFRSGTHPAAWSPTTDEIGFTSGSVVHIGGNDGPDRVLRGHQSQVYLLAWNPGGTLLATSDTTGAIRFWNRDGSPAGSIQEESIVSVLAWHPEKPTLASGSPGNGDIQLSGLDGNLIRSWKARVKGITALSFSPDGERLYSSSNDQQVRVWNEEGHAVGALPGPMAIVSALAWNSAGREIATAHIDGAVCLWDEATYEPKTTTVSFPEGKWARFDSAGISSSSDSNEVEDRFGVITEDESGVIGLMTLSDARARGVPRGD